MNQKDVLTILDAISTCTISIEEGKRLVRMNATSEQIHTYITPELKPDSVYVLHTPGITTYSTSTQWNERKDPTSPF